MLNSKKIDVGPFTFKVGILKNSTKIKMTSATSKLYSSDYKNVENTLMSTLPGVFATECFNESGKSFRNESKDTEIAHLFEHIFLKYFCDLKAEKGEFECECDGATDWDWDKEEYGTFNILLNVGEKDSEEINYALKKSTALFEAIVLDSEDEDEEENDDLITDDFSIFPVPVPAPLYVPAR